MKRKNFTKKLFPAGLTLLALLMLGNLCLTIRETKFFLNWKADFKDWQEEMVCILAEKMTGMLAPASAYLSEDHADTILEWMLTYVGQTIPVQGYLSEMAVKNKEGKNPFEEESSFYLEIEQMGLEIDRKEEDEHREIESSEAFILSELEPESDLNFELNFEYETEELESIEETTEGWEVTFWQEGNISYYQPSGIDSEKEEETQEVFQSRLLQSSAYSLEKLKDFDFLMQKFFTVRETTSIRSGELSVEELLSYDARIKGPLAETA